MNQAEIIQQVSLVFNKLTTDHSTLFSRESILRFLDLQSNKMYDRVLFDQLYAKMPKSNNGYIAINDFITILMEALQSLKNKIQIIEQQMAQKQYQLDDDQLKLQQIQSYEEYNTHDICQGSKIRITIYDAVIQFPGSTRIAIILGCDSTKYSTKAVSRQQPIWNEKFEFAIITGKEDIYLVLLDEELTERQEIGGQAKLVLSDYQDQKPHDVKLNLKDKFGVVQYATVHVKIQWIYSQIKYFKESIKENQQIIDELDSDINEYKSDIIQLFYPFDERKQQVEKVTVTEQSTIQQMHELQIFPDSATAQQWVKLSLGVTLFYALICLIASLYKTQFLDLIVLFYSLWYYMNNNKLISLLHFKIISMMFIITIAFDITWFVIFTRPWVTNSVLFFSSEHGFQLYEVIISYIQLATKVVILLIYMNLYSICPDKRQNIYDAQFERCFGSTSLDSREDKESYSFRNTQNLMQQSFSKYNY